MQQAHDEIMPLDIQSPLLVVRMERGLSQAALAVVLGVPKREVEKIEEGTKAISDPVQEALDTFGLDGLGIAERQLDFMQKKYDWMLKHVERLLGDHP